MRNQVVYNQGDEALFVYVVVCGEFEVTFANSIRDSNENVTKVN